MATPSSATTHRPPSTTTTSRSGTASRSGTGPTVVLVSVVDDNGTTTIAGAASTRDRAAAWLRGPTGRRFITDYGTRDALRHPPERFLDELHVDDLDRHLGLDDGEAAW